MKLYEDVNKQFFIYDNVIDESLFDSILSEIDNELIKGNQSIRFNTKHIKTDTEFKIHNKMYKECNELEIEMFNLNYDNNTDYKLLKRDCDVNLSMPMKERITNKIIPIIKDLYNTNELEIEYESIIQYGPGYLMEPHVDASPNHPRLCTAVLYCNDMKDGDVGGKVLFYDNETKDKNIVYTYQPKRNQMVIFDSHFNKPGIPHSVTKIENWNRYVYRVYFKPPKQNNIKII
jgi:Rps23 Pro-64 3,4-dihydroxylase Tpa1-like proline 4-hydroxylase